MEITCREDDAANFIGEVQAWANGVLRIHAPAELFLINIDNWFSQRWLRFSGKAEGALGVWAVWDSYLTLPPFVPHRVRSERRFAAPAYQEVPIRNPIHIQIGSQYALQRRIPDIVSAASLVWYSGGSHRSGRGSIMAYVMCDNSYWTWYMGLSESGSSWRVVTAKGITAEEFSALKRPT